MTTTDEYAGQHAMRAWLYAWQAIGRAHVLVTVHGAPMSVVDSIVWYAALVGQEMTDAAWLRLREEARSAA